mmetsp:Transcript_11181/g.16972  ORF Transcript_11181/g.16972 Transcript_11181/m.16972 type:complete len:176 (-) Transcript_11181:79-606(-)
MEPEINELLAKTKLIEMVSSVLMMDSGFSPLSEQNWVRWQKLEGLWILINLAFGKEDSIAAMLDKPELLPAVKHILEADCKKDLQMMDLFVYFLGNITGTSSPLRKRIMNEFKVLKLILAILIDNDSVILPFAQNYIWLSFNISEEKGHLTVEEIYDILEILARFFHYCSSKQDE